MNQLCQLMHGGDLRSMSELRPGKSFIDFSANINPLGIPDGVRRALESAMDRCLHYPDHLCRELKDALSGYEEVPSEWILCGNGASDLIFRIAHALSSKHGMLLAPTFSEYQNALEQVVGCEIAYHLLYPETNFTLDETILPLDESLDIVFLCNPNNPSGTLADRALMEKILVDCDRIGAVLVVDECFLDFVEDGESQSLKSLLNRYSNLIILKAFTKIFAIPGVRLGYVLCANAQTLSALDKAGAPWSVSVFAQAAGIAACRERKFVADTVALIAEERAYISSGLEETGIRVFPGAANYILFQSERSDLALQLLDQGIVLRDCSNYKNLAPGYFRTAVRTHRENNILLEGIGRAL